MDELQEENKVEEENKVQEEDKSKDENKLQEEKPSKKKQIIEMLKFLGFSISAGIIQILSFELLYTWIGWKEWWACYLISIVLSVIWNFTFNRKFTFKSSNNIPVAMVLVTIYYCAFIPVSVFGGDALEGIGWDGTLVTAMMMVINFVTEYLFDKFVVFNDKIVNRIAVFLRLKKKS